MGDVALPLRGRSEEEIEGEGNWEVMGVLEGEEGCVAGVAGGDGEAPEPREGTLWAALPSRRRARPEAVVWPDHSKGQGRRVMPPLPRLLSERMGGK